MTILTIGVLALQGAFVEHITLLRAAAAELQGSSSAFHRDDGAREAAAAAAAVPPAPGSSTSTAAATTTAPADLHSSISDDRGSLRANRAGSRESSLPHTSPAAGLHHSQHQPQLPSSSGQECGFEFIEVRTPEELARCSALIIPGGESTSISLIAERTGLLEPLREFVKVLRRPVWGTCAGLILLAESANRSKLTGQELVGGLDVRVQRNYFGRQVESFEADLDLPFLGENEKFHSVFIRAPVVEKILTSNASVGRSEDTVTAPAKKETAAEVEILARLPGRARALKDQMTTAADLGEDGDIVAVKQGNVFGTAFHPELTGDGRIHAWWLREVVKAAGL